MFQPVVIIFFSFKDKGMPGEWEGNKERLKLYGSTKSI